MNSLLILIIQTIVQCCLAYINLSDIDCGKSVVNRGARIVGGSATIPGQFPWMVSITRHGGHFCGGSIINKHWIVTAAHCICSGTGDFMVPKQLKVTIAQYDLREKNSGISYQMDVKNIVVHPEYTCNRVKNDIAMIQIKTSINWSNNVQPACLANSVYDSSYSKYEGSDATVIGWGWLNENTTVGRADILQRVNVKVFENLKCNNWYQSNGKKTIIRDSQMCAGVEHGGKDSCWADSGGPLMIRTEGKKMVIGIVSTGIGCARPRLPGLYTRVSDYIPWIQKVIS
ncbi:trypsin-1-like [Chrysoperla carnea]|uniref:trypsin-1-like n=1 Tax=Chrysoperla carnea TaxID=189513 RepID=UPI001D074DC9|nr:trypsin-1-like [Chrysoperla carnea]